MQTNPRYQIIPGTYGTPTPNVTPAPGPPRPEPLPEMKPVQIDEGPPLPFNGRAFQIPNWGRLSDPQRVALLRRIVMNYGRDPRLRYFVDHRILRPAAVQNREYERQAAAILKWVQDNIRYLNEPGELLQSPWYTLQIASGDCIPKGTLLLREDYTLVPIEELEVGSRIWGRDKWTRVENVWETGKKQITEIRLNNGDTLRLSENHKVFVWSCPLHGAACPDYGALKRRNCAHRDHFVTELRVSELAPGMRPLRPDFIDYGQKAQDPRRARIEGLHLADGWTQDGRFCISGKDGHPKETQKREVAKTCDELGISTRWSERYIQINDAKWAKRLKRCGNRAWNKEALSLDLNKPAADALLGGMLADSGIATSGSLVYGTTSPILGIQARILWKMQGIHCSRNKVDDHGGLGDHPIYRMTPYKRKKALTIKEIRRGVGVAECYDLTTEDHYVYLPESDVIVHNCDDMALLLSSMFESIKLPWRFALSGVEKRHKNDRRPAKHVRWVEGEKFPRNVRWAHIYVRVGNRPFTPDKWHSAEPTIQGVPLGYDVVESRGNLPELGAVKEGEIAVINKSWAARLFADIKPEDIGKALILGAVGAAVGVGVRKVLK